MSKGYTILSARYASEDKTTVIIQTLEFGAVAISEVDRPELWAKLPFVTVDPYVPPVAPIKPNVNNAVPTDGPDVLA